MADPRLATADAYYEHGCRLVDQADRLWADAHDTARPADMRAVSRHAYEQVAARARTRFRRHDVLLDAVARAAQQEPQQP